MFFGTGIIMVDEDVLGTGGWTLICHLPDNLGQNCLRIVATSAWRTDEADRWVVLSLLQVAFLGKCDD